MYFIFIILLSVLPLLNIFLTPYLYHTHDGLVHLARIAAYYKALSGGQFPVRWAGDLNYGYGMPLFNFIYQLPYAVASFFVSLGLNLVNSFKFSMALSYILSGIFMFLFAEELYKDKKKAAVVTVFYQFFPFRLVELFVRGSFGEVYAYSFLPLALFGILKTLKKANSKNIFLGVVGVFLLIISHNSVSLLFFGVCLLFVLIFSRNKTSLIYGFLILVLGLMTSSFYWLPALLEHQYTYGDLYMKDIYLRHFVPVLKLIIPNFNNNFHLWVGGVPVQIGLFHILAIILSLYLFIFKKIKGEDGKIILFSFLLLFISLFFMEPMSKIFWLNLSLLRQFQFPWRFLSVIAMGSSLLSVAYFHLFKKNIFLLSLLILVAGSTLYYWYPRAGFDKVSQNYYWNFPLTTTYYGETDLIWSKGPAKSYPKSRIEVIAGEANIADFVKKSSIQYFKVNAKKDSVIADNTQYFPGWRVYVDNLKVPIQFQDENWRGIITFPIAKGAHDVKVVFQESKIRFIADNISFWSILVLLVWMFGSKKRYET